MKNQLKTNESTEDNYPPYFCEELNKVCPKLGNTSLTCDTASTVSEDHDIVNKKKFYNGYVGDLLSKVLTKFSKRRYDTKDSEVFLDDSDLIFKIVALAKQDDKLFYLSFLKVFPNFSQQLLQINPTLKSHDLEFCALLKLNLDTKEIARIKNISVRAVESKKYRIRKKINISSNECLYNWIGGLKG